MRDQESTRDEKKFNEQAVDWAVKQWQREVGHRPLRNIHRRSLDDTWRQVIRYFGGDDVFLLGPVHDDLVATRSAAIEPAEGG